MPLIYGVKKHGETLDMLRGELNDPSLHVVSIGPAGENLVRGSPVLFKTKGGLLAGCGNRRCNGVKKPEGNNSERYRSNIRLPVPKLFMESVHKIRNMVKKAKASKE